MPLATSENGAAVFLMEGSDEWKAHTAQHGPMLAHSTVNGKKGRWVRTAEFNPLATSEQYAPAPNPPREDYVPPDDAAKARVDATMARLKAALADKNLAAFERPKPVDPDLVQGATAEETERLTAEAKLQRWQANPPPPPKLGRRS